MSVAVSVVVVDHADGIQEFRFTPSLAGTVNNRGWTPLRIADGVALDGLAFIRYPEAAARSRELMRLQGLPVPPIEWDGPQDRTAAR